MSDCISTSGERNCHSFTLQAEDGGQLSANGKVCVDTDTFTTHLMSGSEKGQR